MEASKNPQADSFLSKFNRKVHKFFHPSTHGKKIRRNRSPENFMPFAFSTAALIALQGPISKIISTEVL